MISTERVIDVIQKISEYKPGIDNIEDNSIDILLFDEIEMPNHVEAMYKILDIARYGYDDHHYKCNDKFYDVFVYKGEDIDINKMHQLILCNRYVQIFRFKQDEYEKRILVSEFPYRSKIYAFFDQSMVIVEKDCRSGNMNYKQI